MSEKIIKRTKKSILTDDKKETKQKLCQFFTTNYEYILQDFKIPKCVKKIIEPFCGNSDLLKFVNIKDYKVECYDIGPLHKT